MSILECWCNMKIKVKNFAITWYETLSEIMTEGHDVHPRGKHTKEILQKTIVVDMRRPVLMVPQRSLSYSFMAAEAYWILSADDRVETIAPYNKNISQFSDDGVKFFGAYGPKIFDQFEYVVDKLAQDQMTRQAGLTIWRENPPETKDVPCTVSIFFSIRDGLLNAHVFMRSSDIWLGIPYDVFNFSMLAHGVCSCLRVKHNIKVKPGALYLTAASSHLYAINFDQARKIVDEYVVMEQRPTPDELYENPLELMTRLDEIRRSKHGNASRWWD